MAERGVKHTPVIRRSVSPCDRLVRIDLLRPANHQQLGGIVQGQALVERSEDSKFLSLDAFQDGVLCCLRCDLDIGLDGVSMVTTVVAAEDLLIEFWPLSSTWFRSLSAEAKSVTRRSHRNEWFTCRNISPYHLELFRRQRPTAN